MDHGEKQWRELDRYCRFHFLSVFPPYILDISLPHLLFFLPSRALIASLVSSESIVYRVRKCQRQINLNRSIDKIFVRTERNLFFRGLLAGFLSFYKATTIKAYYKSVGDRRMDNKSSDNCLKFRRRDFRSLTPFSRQLQLVHVLKTHCGARLIS